MYLAELELQGFKSFANKTRVQFDSGITAIVGPNGCGKSNIVDSLRWVLGEQKPSALRSASMSNVIFNGTANKKALGFAEVSVTIHNNKGILPLEYNDITLTRRLFRSGESEYQINGTPCRLKDIVDLFMDTGMGTGAYSVIELKMVEEILNDKTNNRRHLFEEAAGVMKYKERRKQTFKKLEETRTDLQRLDDVLVVIRKNVRSLQLQAQRALKAKEFTEELRHLELGLAKFEIERIDSELIPLKERMVQTELEKDDLNRQVTQTETALQLAKELLAQKELKLRTIQEVYNETMQQLRDAETTLRITKEKIVNEEQTIQQYEQDIFQAEKEIAELKQNIIVNKKELEFLEKEVSEIAVSLNDAQEAFELFQKATTDKQTQLKDVTSKHQHTNQLLSLKETHKIKLESRLENLDEDFERVERQIKSLAEELNGLKSNEQHSGFSIEEAHAQLEKSEHELDKARHDRERLQIEINQKKDEIRKDDSTLDGIESEIQLLQGIAKSHEAFPSSVQYLLEKDASTFKVVSEVLSTDETHSVALESVLGEAVNFIVVDTKSDAHRGIQLLKENGKGRAAFIPLDALKTVHHIQDKSLAYKVSCDKKYLGVRDLFLSNVLVIADVEHIPSEITTHQATGVTLEGDIITHDSIIKAGSKQKNIGIRTGLKDKIEKLERRALSIEDDVEKKKRHLLALDMQFQSIVMQVFQERVRENQQLVRKLESELSSFLAQKAVLEKNLNALEIRKNSILEQQAASQKELDELLPSFSVLKEELELFTAQEIELRSELEKITENRNRAQTRFNEINLSFQDKKNKRDNFAREIERDEKQIQSIKERLTQRAEHARMSKDRIIGYRQFIEDETERLEEQREKVFEIKTALDEADLDCAKERGKINQLDDASRQIQRKREVNMEISHQLSLTKSQYDMLGKQISDHIWESYSLMIEDIKHSIPDDTDVDVVRQTVQGLKQKLKNIGEVNPLAIEEYEEEQKKLTFYEEQIADLLGAEAKLKETIDEINQTAQERFLTTFNQIRTNFIDVFKTLFEETDNCDLIIEENQEDPLESKIEIFAQPKGKRPSHINQLSGGEKTLTAIALLFAIYLVKPSPFCILDEVDAPLDDANIERYAKIIRRFSKDTQFIIITHNKKTMEKAERMYGVTMQETGVSSLVGVQMGEMI
ncbi:chromosome segregation protein SMC [bacterium]|nr:MAG: chromosome segregation protein SMC [bacterium]